jgi:hypothetical protein
MLRPYNTFWFAFPHFKAQDFQTMQSKMRHCNLSTQNRVFCGMARIVIVEFLMFVGALLVTYGLRRLLGKRISGPPVVLWCLLFAVLGAQLMSFFLRQVAFDSDFIDLSGSSVLTILSIVLVRFWENILLGAGLGMILAFFPLRKNKKTLEDTKPSL